LKKSTFFSTKGNSESVTEEKKTFSIELLKFTFIIHDSFEEKKFVDIFLLVGERYFGDFDKCGSHFNKTG